MAIALEQTIEAGVTTGNITLPSWTPGSNELVLVAVMQRNETIAPTLSGNGLTFVSVLDIDDNQGQCGVVVFRAMGASPSTGAITVTLTGNTVPAYAIAARFSGVDTGGTNGSAACEATASATTGGTDNGNITVAVTTVTNDAWAYGAVCTHGSGTLTLVDETAIDINNTIGSAGDVCTAHAFYQAQPTAGSTTLLGASSFSNNREWAIAAIAIKPAGGGTTFTQSVAGTLTTAGTIALKTAKSLGGTLTTAGALIRKAGKAVAGTLTTAGALVRKAKKIAAGTLTTAGAVTAFRKFVKTLAGTLTSSGALVRKGKKTLAGTLTTGGALVKKTFKTFAGTLIPAGGLTSQILQIYYQVVGGTLTTAGALTRKAKRTVDGTLTTAGTVIRKAKKVVAGTLTSSGALNRGIAAAAVALSLAARAVLSLPNRLRTWTIAVRNTLTVRDK